MYVIDSAGVLHTGVYSMFKPVLKMAEGGEGRPEEDLTVGSESEFVFDYFCEHCQDDGLNVEADGYCVNCEVYLCANCVHAHKQYRPTRRHELLDQGSMPKNEPLSYDRTSKDISTFCGQHKSKPVEFYCKSHDALGCSMCFATLHKYCNDVESVHEKSENILDSKEYVNFVSCLRDLEQSSHTMAEIARHNATAADTIRSTVKHQMKTFKDEVINVLETLEKLLISKVETITAGDKARMERLKMDFECFSKELEHLTSEIHCLVASKRICQLYIQMKERKNQVASLEGNLRGAEAKIDIREIEFEPSDISETLTTVCLGRIINKKINSNQTAITTSDDIRDINDVTAVRVSDIDLGTDSDTNELYYVSSSAVMSDTRLVVADYCNQKVKLVDTEKGKIVAELKFTGYPFDIVVISPNQAVVSTVCYQRLHLLRVVKDTMEVGREIVVDGECRGVAYYQNQLFVTYDDIPRVDMIDLQGNVLQTIKYSKNGDSIFTKPWYVCVSSKCDNLYIADDDANNVFCLTIDGEVKQVFDRVTEPQKICTDKFGHIYVADYNKKTVHVVTADLSNSKVILSEKDGWIEP